MAFDWKEMNGSAKVDRYREEIRERNYKSFNAFLFIGTVISVMVMLFGFVMHEVVTFNTEFFIMFLYCTSLSIVSRLLLKKNKRHITLIFYGALTPLMFLGILMGTFLDPTQPSITIMVFLCVLPMFVMDKPLRIVLYITGTSLLYAVCCYLAKDFSIFLADMIDLVTFYFLGVGINCFVLKDRIDSVENFVRYRDKSEIDLLTGLYNRGAGVDKIEALLTQKKQGTFFIMDIDDFKEINDQYGHTVGDEVLRMVASIVREDFRHDAIVMRMGGDEFAAFSVGMTEKQECEQRLEQLLRHLKETTFSMLKTPLTISIGCSVFDESVPDFETLYKNADEGLYCTKRAGKAGYHIQ